MEGKGDHVVVDEMKAFPIGFINAGEQCSPLQVETPVLPVGAIIDRPLVRLKVIVFGATGASLPTDVSFIPPFRWA